MMGPRNDGRTGLTRPHSLTLSYRSISDRHGRAGGLSKSREERAEERQLYFSSPFSSFLLLPRHRLEKSRSLASSAREHGRHMAEEEEGEDGSGRTGAEEGGGAQINFLDPLRGGRASVHQDSLILPFRVGRRPKPTMGWL